MEKKKKTKPRFASVLPEGSQKHPASQKTIILKPNDRLDSGKLLLCCSVMKRTTRFQVGVLIAEVISEQKPGVLLTHFDDFVTQQCSKSQKFLLYHC